MRVPELMHLFQSGGDLCDHRLHEVDLGFGDPDPLLEEGDGLSCISHHQLAVSVRDPVSEEVWKAVVPLVCPLNYLGKIRLRDVFPVSRSLDVREDLELTVDPSQLRRLVLLDDDFGVCAGFSAQMDACL